MIKEKNRYIIGLVLLTQLCLFTDVKGQKSIINNDIRWFDTLEPKYYINRMPQDFLNDQLCYNMASHIVIKRKSKYRSPMMSEDGVSCQYVDIYYNTDIDSIFNAFMFFISNTDNTVDWTRADGLPTPINFDAQILERGFVICLDINKKFIRIINENDCINKSKSFNRLLRRLNKSKEFSRVCFLRCYGQGFGVMTPKYYQAPTSR